MLRKIAILLLFFMIGMRPMLSLLWPASVPIFSTPENFIWVFSLICASTQLVIWILNDNIIAKKILCGLIFYVMASLSWLDATEYSRGIYVSGMIIFPILMAVMIKGSGLYRQCAASYIFGALLSLLVLLLYQVFFGQGLITERFGNIITDGGNRLNPNGLASHLAVAALFCFFLTSSYSGTGRVKSPYFLISLLLLGAVILTGSRTSLLALFSVYIVFRLRGRDVWIIRGIAFLLIVPLVFILFSEVSFSSGSYIQRFIDLDNIYSLGSRVQIFIPAYDVMVSGYNNLFFGVGSGGSWKALGAVADHPSINYTGDNIPRLHSHNGFLEIILNWGLLGALIFSVAIILLYRGLTRDLTVLQKRIYVSAFVFIFLISLGTVPFVHSWYLALTTLLCTPIYKASSKIMEWNLNASKKSTFHN